MKKIVITNAYTWYNKGDAGILLGIVDSLKDIYGEDNIEINILSFTPEEDKKRYCKDKTIKNVYSNVLNPHPYIHTKIGKIVAILKLIKNAIKIKIKMLFDRKSLADTNDSIKILNESDLIIVCGGGFLGGKKLDSLMHLYQININTKFNKPVIIMGTSIEPIKNMIVEKYTKKILNKVDLVYAREKITYTYLKEFMPNEKIELIPDMAFMIKDKKQKMEKIEKIREKYDYIFGLTVRKWNFPNSNNSKELMKQYIKTIKETIIELSQKQNCCFIFVPQVIVNYANDIDVAKEIKGQLPKKVKERVFIYEDDYSPEEIKQLIWNCDYFIGTRMHSNIFATSMKIPTTAIAYEKKTNGIMETVGLEEYVVEIDTITKEKLIETVERGIKNSENIKKQLNERIEQIRKEILEKLNKHMKEL